MKKRILKIILIGLAVGVAADLLIGFFVTALLWFGDDLNEPILFAYVFLIPLIFTLPGGIGITFAVVKAKEKEIQDQKRFNKEITDKLHQSNVIWTKTAMHDGLQIIADYQNRKIWWLNWNTGYWSWWTFAKVRACKLNIKNKSWGGGYSAYSFGSTVVGQTHEPITENSVFEIIIELNNEIRPFVISLENLKGEYVTSEKFEKYVDFAIQVETIINETPKS